jgi:hypothetical protein
MVLQGLKGALVAGLALVDRQLAGVVGSPLVTDTRRLVAALYRNAAEKLRTPPTVFRYERVDEPRCTEEVEYVPSNLCPNMLW